MNKHEAIYKLYPNVKYIHGDTAYDENENEVTYDNTLVEAEVSKSTYQQQRKIAYASIQEQLDMQYWDKINGTTTWKDHIDSIKAQYPKGE